MNLIDSKLRKLVKEYIYFDLSKGKAFWIKSTNKRIKIGSEIKYSKRGYIYFRFFKKDYRLHRFIFSIAYSKDIYDDQFIDHKDGDTSNNSIYNLRIATRSQNGCNQKISKANTTGYKGVFFLKKAKYKKYGARIKINKKLVHLGNFDTKLKAHKAYCEASKKYHGDFGRLK